METATVILSLLLAIICVMSALMDFRKDPKILQSLAKINCPYPPNLLGSLKALSAAGLVIGIWFTWLGSVTAICLAAYFFIAIAYHRRAKESFADFAPAAVLMLVSLATFVVSLAAN